MSIVNREFYFFLPDSYTSFLFLGLLQWLGPQVRCWTDMATADILAVLLTSEEKESVILC